MALLFGVALAGGDKKPTKSKGPLPSGWKKLDLTSAQKEQVYTIQSEYRKKVADLKKQLLALQKQRDSDLLKVLTKKQRAQLAGLDEEGGKDKDTAAKDKKKPDKK
jgi:Spy/CpxP family protein refolding chaperone